MLGRVVLFAVAVIGFAIIAVPRGGLSTASQQANAKEQPRTAAQPPATASAPFSSGWPSGDHTLSRRSDGHFYANTTVNGAQVRMLVDTGASVIALTGADAQTAGIYWDESDVRPVGRGASGNVYGVHKRLDRVTIGDLSETNVDAVIVPRGLDVSLLGQSYLSRLSSVDISGDTMELSAK